MSRGRKKCPDCGRVTATYIPKGADGSADVFRRHVVRLGAKDPKRCPRSGTLVLKNQQKEAR